jgi:ribonuclease PH
MIRIDGRKCNDVRPVKITKNFITSASGSFQISIGCTTVMVAVFNKKNPEAKKKRLELEIDSFGLLFNPEITNLCNASLDIILKENLNLLPQYEITINVFIIENDGNLFIALLNALSQGLKEVKLWNSKEIIFSGVSIYEKNREIYIDPSKYEYDSKVWDFHYAMIYDLKFRKIKIYEILKLFEEEEYMFMKNKKKLKRIIIEFGFYLFKLFN